jgi:GDPmannose 4,6-dehydratase
MQDNLKLGNLDAKRDWGFAGDYVVGMFKILDYERPDNFVLATGVTTTVREFAKQSFAHVGIELHFEGEGVNERGVDVATGRELVIVSPEFFRPAEVDLLIGDPAKAKELLDWEPTVTVNQLSRMMVEADLADLAKIRN